MKLHSAPELLLAGHHHVPVSKPLQIQKLLGSLIKMIAGRRVQVRVEGQLEAVDVDPCLKNNRTIT